MKHIKKTIISFLIFIFSISLSSCNNLTINNEEESNHNYSSEWSTSSEYHWHACTDDGCYSVSNYEKHTEAEWVITTSATATTDGEKTKTCSVCGCVYSKEVIPALGHNYGQITYTWSNDNKKCTATVSCTDEGCTESITETVTAIITVKTNATCTSNRVDLYTATFTNKLFTCQTKSVEAENAKTSHNYSTVQYTWNADYTKCTAERHCTNTGCTESQTETVNSSKRNKSATCLVNAHTIYTASFTNSSFATQVKDIETANTKTSHTYSNPTYTWSTDYTECTAERHCTVSGCTQKETETVDSSSSIKTNATTTSNRIDTYTVTFTNTAFTVQTKDVEILNTKISHTYSDPTYTWNTDYTKCTAERHCTNAGCTESQTETVDSTVAVESEATYIANKKNKYTATFTNQSFTVQYKVVEVADTKKPVKEAFETYLSEFNNSVSISSVTSTTYTFAGGVGQNDITNYIKSLDCDYEWNDEFEIHDKTLYYVGDNYKADATSAGITTGTATDLRIKAVLNTAYAYLYQSNQIQYDMYSSRRNVNINPEYATNYSTVFLDCSSFVNSVYYNTFGKNLLNGYSTEKPVTSTFNTVMSGSYGTQYGLVNNHYYVSTNYSTTESKQNVIESIKNDIQPGDLINFIHYNGSSQGGHVLMYIGDNLFIHCTGSSYVASSTNVSNNNIFQPNSIADNATNLEKEFGAVGIISADNLFTESGPESDDRYLFSSEYTWTKFCLIRPINITDSSSNKVMNTITDIGKNRLSIPNVSIEKSCDKAQYAVVTPGTYITYTITLKNNNNYSISYITVTDKASDNVSITNVTDGSNNNNTAVWKNITLAANETKTLTYKVKIQKGLTVGTIIGSNEGYVNGVPLNELYLEIGNTTIQSKLSEIETYAKNLALDSQSFTNSLELIKNVYQNYNYTIFDSATSVSSILDSLFSTPTNDITSVVNTSSEYYSYLIPTYYGGLSISKNSDAWKLNNDRLRLVDPSYLQTGDIILTAVPSAKGSSTYTYEAYMIVSNSSIIYVNEGNAVLRTSELGEKNSKTIDSSSTTQFLEQLTGYNRWVILRPSVAINN